MFHIKVFQCLDSNRGPLVLEATTLPTELQPLPLIQFFVKFYLAIIATYSSCSIFMQHSFFKQMTGSLTIVIVDN